MTWLSRLRRRRALLREAAELERRALRRLSEAAEEVHARYGLGVTVYQDPGRAPAFVLLGMTINNVGTSKSEMDAGFQAMSAASEGLVMAARCKREEAARL